MLNKLFLKRSFTSKLAIVVAVASVIAAISTYIAMTSSSSLITPNSKQITILLFVDLVLFLTFAILISRRLMQFYTKKHIVGSNSKIQTRILMVFSIIACIPTITVAIFSTVFFNFVIESWFDKRITTALDESVIVAESYLKEHKDVLRVRTKAMAMELDNNIIYYDLTSNMPMFFQILNTFVELNAVSEAVVFNNNIPIVKSKYGNSLSFERFPIEAFQKAAEGEVVILDNNPNKIRSVVALSSLPSTYLVVGKLIDSNVLNHIAESQGAASKYRAIKDRLNSLQIKFSLIFLAVSLLILVIALWFGITFSSKITKPIQRLLEATEKIKEGKFSFRVKEGKNNDELSYLAKAFNLMTKHIAGQQEKLVDAYNKIEDKHKFSQTVLSGVSAGIIALSSDKKIILINDSALKMLQLKSKDVHKKNITNIIPELNNILQNATQTPDTLVSEELSIKIKRKLLNIVFRVVAESDNKRIDGFIVTFDDMTQLVQAQRLAAWSDVARRIAHEVKNPLTPIQLSADRLKTKFADQVNDKEAFSRYLSTIIRHTADIAEIIGEFSNFAKMKSPTLEEFDIAKSVSDIVLSRQYLDNKIKYSFESNKQSINIFADQTQITQVIVNLLKNSEESLHGTKMYESGKSYIDVKLEKVKNSVKIKVVDNGKGFDKDIIARLTEAYFTTRTKGTGLGLSIVQKIIDDHKGSLDLYNNSNGRAVVEIELPLN
ncbi:MAG: ATP-binding protein [Rickettsiales bacterium]